MSETIPNTTREHREPDSLEKDELVQSVQAGDLIDFANLMEQKQAERSDSSEPGSVHHKSATKGEARFRRVAGRLTAIMGQGKEAGMRTPEELIAILSDPDNIRGLDPADPLDHEMLDTENDTLRFVVDHKAKLKDQIRNMPGFAEMAEKNWTFAYDKGTEYKGGPKIDYDDSEAEVLDEKELQTKAKIEKILDEEADHVKAAEERGVVHTKAMLPMVEALEEMAGGKQKDLLALVNVFVGRVDQLAKTQYGKEGQFALSHASEDVFNRILSDTDKAALEAAINREVQRQKDSLPEGHAFKGSFFSSNPSTLFRNFMVTMSQAKPEK